MPSLGREVVLGIRTAKVEDERRSLMAALQEAQLERDEPGTLLQPGRGCHARAGGITGSSFRLVPAAPTLMPDGSERVGLRLLKEPLSGRKEEEGAPGTALVAW